MAECRAVVDGTPLLGSRTGIGRYTASLVRALATTSSVDVSMLGLTLRGWSRLRTDAPPGTRVTGFPVPARALRRCWARGAFPPVEMLARSADVVHGTNFVLPPAVRTPGVVTVHDLAFLDAPEELPPAERELPDLVRRSVHRAAVVCTPTSAVGAEVCERFRVPRSKVAVTPLGVDPEWFAAVPPDERLRSRHGLPEEYLVFVGADGPRKNLSGLLRALDSRLPPLVVAGPGTSSPRDRVVRTGYLPDEELRRLVAGARALVLPSRDEGFGLPALEALACGVPVVCSDVAALREVTGGHATLFPSGDETALRDALGEVLTHSADPGSAAARREHAAGFSWKACAEATLDAYRRAL